MNLFEWFDSVPGYILVSIGIVFGICFTVFIFWLEEKIDGDETIYDNYD